MQSTACKSGYASGITKVLLQMYPEAHQPKSLVVALNLENQICLVLGMLAWMSVRSMRPIHQRLQTAIPADDPTVNALTIDFKEPCSITDIVSFLCLFYYSLTKLCNLSYTSHAESNLLILNILGKLPIPEVSPCLQPDNFYHINGKPINMK